MKVLYEIPLYSQNWNLDEWKKLGFSSRDDAEYWERSCCGILCVNEIASFLNETKYSTSSLIKQGQELGGYSEEYGWKHEGLVRLVEKLGLHAERKTLSTKELQKALEEKKLPIVSIKWAFKNNKLLIEKILFWKRFGGHLAVVVGYDDEGFYVNHTSKVAEQNWKAGLVPYDKFNDCYTGRAILVWK
ncbi:MAG: C39 family peptidase [Candidatus Berkelbacteria bacterium]|nr:MAG: C39 family peptidase [Candidatus Berkelbacteria bacterium]QQG51959.1 MAG: C39 family peptidase [Candidatus Berkelbacteria bacterium]